MQEKEVTIVGAGLVGSLLAILLSKEGFCVSVFEKREDPAKFCLEEGRSINLALSYRGLKALKMAGVAEKVFRKTLPMKGRMLHNLDGRVLFQPYGEEGQAIYSTSRFELTELLIEEGRSKHGVLYHFKKKCEGIDVEQSILTFKDVETGEETKKHFSMLFGADGAFSVVRSFLETHTRFNYAQSFLEYGYKELLIRPGEQGKHQMAENALHIWPREKFMLIALPNHDGSFTATLFLNFEGEISFSSLRTEEALHCFFQHFFPDALQLMPELTERFFTNPVGSLVTVKGFPWVYKSKIALIGDAAHAIVPFYGQGMNAGFEDCYQLIEILKANKGKGWSEILEQYQQARKENTDAIAELALRNFVEMRDLVADEKFLLAKKIESRIHQKFPAYLPLYSMVTFSDLSYSEALKTGSRQEELMHKIMQIPKIDLFWETEELWEKAKSLLDGYFEKISVKE